MAYILENEKEYDLKELKLEIATGVDITEDLLRFRLVTVVITNPIYTSARFSLANTPSPCKYRTIHDPDPTLATATVSNCPRSLHDDECVEIPAVSVSRAPRTSTAVVDDNDH